MPFTLVEKLEPYLYNVSDITFFLVCALGEMPLTLVERLELYLYNVSEIAFL
jgi:hypothetical protein